MWPVAVPERRSSACRHFRNVSVQKHDARLDRLSRLPESNFAGLMKQHENLCPISLAARAAAIRLGLVPKYWSLGLFLKVISLLCKGFSRLARVMNPLRNCICMVRHRSLPFFGSIPSACESHYPVLFPGLVVVIGECLLEARGIGRNV
jgi:hypothetical protein